ncbi:hypothetical protein [Xanthobacter versatilis]|uniref:hypothetical protein n=1 Tax=Xanthobacter autotrophicus (strain ATCC BAA-1158 / Py2) TaxID=78245 RepID=UPI003727D8CD
MSERSPSRRSLLKGATAALLTVPATITALEADPLFDLVTAYHDECAWLDALDGGFSDVTPMPVWDALNLGHVPTATTKEGATAALKLAVELSDSFGGAEAIKNLIHAALGFLEGAAA